MAFLARRFFCNFSFRNQFFVAVTRSKAWLELSGIGDFPLYQEVERLCSVKINLLSVFSSID